MHHTDLSAPPGQPGIQGTGMSSTDMTTPDMTGTGTESTVGAVRQEAMDQVRTVAQAARRETQNVVGEIGTEVRGQVAQQKDRLALLLKDISAELAEVPASGSGRVSDLAWTVAGRTGDLSDWLRNHEATDILRATEDFARRRPLTFLLASTVAGVVVGRLTRGMIDGDGERAAAVPEPRGQRAAYPTTTGYPAGYPTSTGQAPAPVVPVTPDTPITPVGTAPTRPAPAQPWEGA